jgi:hypothetical protein
MGELYYAIQQGKQHKTLSIDGIGYEFYKILWGKNQRQYVGDI